MSNDNYPCYIARKPECGCMVCAAVDMPEHKKDTAKTVAGWIKDGLTVSMATAGEVRKGPFGCIHKEQP